MMEALDLSVEAISFILQDGQKNENKRNVLEAVRLLRRRHSLVLATAALGLLAVDDVFQHRMHGQAGEG